jgi:hypothetical protein
MARKRHVKPGNLHDLQRVLWAAIVEVEALLDVRPCSTEVVLRSAHALAQLASAYRGVVEIVSIEERIATLERAAAERTNR